MIVTKVPGLDTPEAFAAHRGGADHRHRALLRPPTSRSWSSTRARYQRQLIWSELDANPADPRDVTLIVRPGGELRREGERYIVALRNLRDASGRTLEAQNLPSDH